MQPQASTREFSRQPFLGQAIEAPRYALNPTMCSDSVTKYQFHLLLYSSTKVKPAPPLLPDIQRTFPGANQTSEIAN
jgi:hypothetical protein